MTLSNRDSVWHNSTVGSSVHFNPMYLNSFIDSYRTMPDYSAIVEGVTSAVASENARRLDQEVRDYLFSSLSGFVERPDTPNTLRTIEDEALTALQATLRVDSETLQATLRVDPPTPIGPFVDAPEPNLEPVAIGVQEDIMLGEEAEEVEEMVPIDVASLESALQAKVRAAYLIAHLKEFIPTCFTEVTDDRFEQHLVNTFNSVNRELLQRIKATNNPVDAASPGVHLLRDLRDVIYRNIKVVRNGGSLIYTSQISQEVFQTSADSYELYFRFTGNSLNGLMYVSRTLAKALLPANVTVAEALSAAIAQFESHELVKQLVDSPGDNFRVSTANTRDKRDFAQFIRNLAGDTASASARSLPMATIAASLPTRFKLYPIDRTYLFNIIDNFEDLDNALTSIGTLLSCINVLQRLVSPLLPRMTADGADNAGAYANRMSRMEVATDREAILAQTELPVTAGVRSAAVTREEVEVPNAVTITFNVSDPRGVVREVPIENLRESDLQWIR